MDPRKGVLRAGPSINSPQDGIISHLRTTTSIGRPREDGDGDGDGYPLDTHLVVMVPEDVGRRFG